MAAGAPKPDARLEALATLAIVGGLAALIAARPLVRRLSPHPSQEQCAAMLARYAEQEARAENRGGPALEQAPREVERCVRELTLAEVECALKASNVDEIERCLP